MKMAASTPRFAKIIVTLEPRDDGGLRAYSDDVPGFVLSNRDPSIVLSDVPAALAAILSAMWGVKVVAGPLVKPNRAGGFDGDLTESTFSPREYAACAS